VPRKSKQFFDKIHEAEPAKPGATETPLKPEKSKPSKPKAKAKKGK